MKNFVLVLIVVLFGFSLATANRNRKENLTDVKLLCLQTPRKTTSMKAMVSLDTATIRLFSKKYPKLKK
jgi:hypothetical protein